MIDINAISQNQSFYYSLDDKNQNKKFIKFKTIFYVFLYTFSLPTSHRNDNQ